MKYGAPYWTVNVPHVNLELRGANYKEAAAKRKVDVQKLRDAGYTKRCSARNTYPQATALAAEIKAKLGIDMEVNETNDLYL